MQTEKPPEPALKVHLEPDRLDLSSVKVQMSVGALLAILTLFVSYWGSLQTGFLLDDYLHLDFVSRATLGDWHDFASNFWSNWAGSDIMQSYRPVVSASLFLDYLVWKTNAFGFHLTNLILTAFSAILVGLITLEITGQYGNRLGASAAIWSALLFAVYPLHPEAVVWVIGRVDLICTAFFLTSLLCYLRFRRLKEAPYLAGALASFALSLFSKEMAVTLPLVITAAELLLPLDRTGNQPGLKQRLTYVGSFWAMLTLLAAGRMLMLGTLIGGYGNSTLLDTIEKLKVFADKATILKILYPANEEIMQQNWLRSLIVSCYGAGAVLLVSRLFASRSPARPICFLLVSTAILVLPAFQIWHIHPNLVGSRLFYLASAPFCILTALACLPAVDIMSRKLARITATAGTLILICLFLCWYGLLEGNLKPWIQAGKFMTALKDQVQTIAERVPAGKAALLLNLPTDYSGAGMLTRPQYLDLIAAPPFTAVNQSSKLLTIEPPISGSHDFMWPGLFKQMINDSKLASIWRWSRSDGRFTPWETPAGISEYKFNTDSATVKNLSFEPQDVNLFSGNHWQLETEGKATVTAWQDNLLINPGQSGLTLSFPSTAINPTEATIAAIHINIRTDKGCQGCTAGRIKLLWASDDASQISPDTPAGFTGHAGLRNRKNGSYWIWLGRYRSWTLNGKVSRLALRFDPGQYSVHLKGLTIQPMANLVPSLSVHAKPPPFTATNARQLWMQTYRQATPISVEYDVSNIPEAEWTRIIATKSGVTFDSNAEKQIEMVNPPSAAPDNDSLSVDITELKAAGTLNLPDDLTGTYQIRIQPLTKAGLPAGFPSEPVTIQQKRE